MTCKKWRVTKRDDKWLATSPPLATPAYPVGCCIRRSFPTWGDAMAFAHNWIEGERRDRQAKALKIMNDSIRRLCR